MERKYRDPITRLESKTKRKELLEQATSRLVAAQLSFLVYIFTQREPLDNTRVMLAFFTMVSITTNLATRDLVNSVANNTDRERKVLDMTKAIFSDASNNLPLPFDESEVEGKAKSWLKSVGSQYEKIKEGQGFDKRIIKIGRNLSEKHGIDILTIIDEATEFLEEIGDRIN